MNDLWLDISAFQGAPSPVWFAQLKAAGYTGVWVQLWGLGPSGNGSNPYAETVLARARNAGLLTGGYIVLYPSTIFSAVNVSLGLTAAGAEAGNMRFVAIDLEAQSPMDMAKVTTARAALITAGQRPAIYTSKHTWGLMFGAAWYPFPFTDPLIEARYVLPSGSCPDVPPNLDWNWQSFGGWLRRAMLQYGGTCSTFGIGADRNVANATRMGYNIPEEDDMAVEDQLIISNQHLGNISVKLDSAVNLDLEMDYIVAGLKLMLDAMTALNAEVKRLRELTEAGGSTVPGTGAHSHIA